MSSLIKRAHRKRAYEKKKQTLKPSNASLMPRIVVFGAMLLSMFAYVLQINSISVKGFEIFELEQQNVELERENQRLELHIAQMQSSGQLKQQIDGLGMISEGGIEYVSVEEFESEVAAK